MISEIYHTDYSVSRALATLEEGSTKCYANLPSNVYAREYGSTNKAGWMQENFMFEVLSAVSEKYPHYTFYCSTLGFLEGDRETVSDVLVFHKQEPLGRIEDQHRDGILFDNMRIAGDTRRGRGKKTTNLTTAKKLFAKYFYGITLPERMEVVRQDVDRKLSSTIYDMRKAQHVAESAVQTFIANKLEVDSEPLLKALEVIGATELIEKYRIASQELELVRGVEQVRKDSKGYYVLLQDTVCFIWRKGQTAVRRVERSLMWDELKLALGVLKLADEDTFVAGAGFKLAHNKFFIYDEVQLGFDE